MCPTFGTKICQFLSVTTTSILAFQGELTAGTWEETTENLSFADFTFVLTKHHLKKADGTDRQKEGSSEEEKEKDESKKDEEDQGTISLVISPA